MPLRDAQMATNNMTRWSRLNRAMVNWITRCSDQFKLPTRLLWYEAMATSVDEPHSFPTRATVGSLCVLTTQIECALK